MYHHVRRDICGEDGEMLIPMVVIWLRLFGANRDAGIDTSQNYNDIILYFCFVLHLKVNLGYNRRFFAQ